MRLRTSFSAVTLIVALALAFAGASQAADPTLVARYPFDGNANDLTNNGHDGTLNGGATFAQDRFGRTMSALSLDGLDDFVEVPHHPNLNVNPTGFSVALWAKASPSQFSGDSHFNLIDKSHGVDEGWTVQGRTDLNDSGFIICYEGSVSCDPGVGTSVPATRVLDDRWHCLVGTLDPPTINLFLDGGVEDSNLATGTPGANELPLFIGQWNPGLRHFHGREDDLRIYQRALTRAQVRAFCLRHPIAFTSERSGSDIYSMYGTTQTRLTTHPGLDLYPAFSADGDKIAFASKRDGNFEIYSMNADGSATTRLTANPAADSQPSFSPDGTKIAFVSQRSGNADIYVMNANGTAQTRLTTNPAPATEPSFSPDGTKIAFTSGDIYVMNADGTGLARLTTHPAIDSSPDWSPDGKRIAFTSGRSGSDIYVMSVATRTLRRLTSGPTIDDQAAFLKGGKIAFNRDDGSNVDVYVMNANGNAKTRLTTNPAPDIFPDSP